MCLASWRIRVGQGLAWLLLVLTGAVFAQEEDPGTLPFILAGGVQSDAEGSASALVSADVGVTQSTWVSVAAVTARSPSERAGLDTRSLSVGLDQRIAAFGLSLGLERWGESGEIESDDWDVGVSWRGAKLRLGAGLERRDFGVTFQFTGPGGRTFSRESGFDADGVTGRISYDFTPEWRLFASGRRYDYSVDLTLVPRLDVFRLLSTSTLTLTNSLVDYQYSAGIEREFGDKVLSATLGRDRSAVDKTVLETFDLGLLLPLAPRVDIELSLGLSNSDDFGSEAFGGVFLFFYGGG